MTNDLISHLPNSAVHRTDNAWGSANPQRGVVKDENPQKYFELAVKFVGRHPPGSSLTVTEFDAFLADEQVMAPAPSRKSNRWLAHVRDRRFHRVGLAKAACHPRMRDDYKIEPFDLKWLLGGKGGSGGAGKRIRVVPLVTATVSQPAEFNRRTKGWYKEVKYLLQGFDRLSQSPQQNALIENYHELIKNFVDDTERALARAQDRARKTLQLLNPAAMSRPLPNKNGDPSITGPNDLTLPRQEP